MTINFSLKIETAFIDFDRNTYLKQTNNNNSKSSNNAADEYQLILKNSIHPQIYSVIKLIKEYYSPRPVVSDVTALANKISKYLLGIIRDVVESTQNIHLAANAKFVS